MGKRYAEGGEDQARAVMKDLAASPHTAHHIAVKIARHFVADDPPPSLVARLRKVYLETDGQLGAVAKTLIQSPGGLGPGAAQVQDALRIHGLQLARRRRHAPTTSPP